MSQIDLMRREIERRSKLHHKELDEKGLPEDYGASVEDDYLLSFLDTIQEQPVSEDLEEEIKSWHKRHFKSRNAWEDYSGHYLDKNSQLDLARHFYELGRQSKPKVCEGLEEEIQKYMSKRWEFGCINPTTPVYLYDFTTDELKECARHFAKWQKEQDEKELSEKIALVKGINELLRSVKED